MFCSLCFSQEQSNGLFALKIGSRLLRSGKGESGSEYCNEFINFPHKCQALQWSFNCYTVACSFNSWVLLSLFILVHSLSSACASLSNKQYTGTSRILETKFDPQNSTPQLLPTVPASLISFQLFSQCWTPVVATPRSFCGATPTGWAPTRYANSLTSTPNRRTLHLHSRAPTLWPASGSTSLHSRHHM